jgi:hypothetical protein
VLILGVDVPRIELIENDGGAFSAERHELLKVVALDDLAGRIARVGRKDNLETLSLDVFLREKGLNSKT